MRHRFLALIAVLLIASLSLAGCGGGAKPAQPGQAQGGQQQASQPQAPKGKQVTIGMWSPPNNFSPINTDSSYGYLAVSILFDSLLKIDDNLNFTPKLAERYEVSDDLTTYTFYLNKNAKWHDGKPVTAQDVEFTIKTVAHPKTETNRGSYIATLAGLDAKGKNESGNISGVKVIDDHTIQFKTAKPVDKFFFLEAVGANIFPMPKHILGGVAPEALTKHEFFMNPKVGSGPFKFVKYATDQYIELERNDDYYLGKPKLEKVFIRIMKPTTAVAALEKGELDLTAGPGIGEIPITDWDKVKSLPNVDAISFPSNNYQYMDINFDIPTWKDPRVRQALAHAINRQLIVDRLLKGNGKVVNGPIMPVTRYYNKNIEGKLEYNPEKAKQLLQQAGFDFNQEIVLTVPTGNLVREQSADIIMANLQAVGMKVKIQKFDFPTLQAKRKAGEYSLALIGWGGPLDPDVSSQFKTGGQYNQGKRSDAKTDDLLTRGAETAKFEDRKKIYDELQEYFAENPPAIFLYSPNGLTAKNKRVEGVHLNFVPFRLTADIHLWDVKE